MYKNCRILLPVLCCILLTGLALPPVCAAGIQDYTTTHTITLTENGTALWNIEYRTPLSTDNDTEAFEEYAHTLNSTYLPDIKDLMGSSATRAAASTSRPMSVGNFTGAAAIQTTPTGKSGVITISFAWTNFSVSSGDRLTAGDAFVGGLYLSKDAILVIRYPGTCHVISTSPVPDQQEGTSLIWYGIRSFDIGEPAIVLEKNGFPILPAAGICLIIIIAGAGFILYQKKKKPAPVSSPSVPELPDEPEEDAPPVSEADRRSVEDRILRQLKENGGEQYQSELARALGIPKSTLSSALHELSRQGIIVKVKKGRENLIRLDEKYR